MHAPHCKRALALILTLSLAMGLAVVPASAAAPGDSLPSYAYYGDRSKCQMSVAMAKGYADALANYSDDAPAMLVDPANDGIPFLAVTSRPEVADPNDFLLFWTWDGSQAEPLDELTAPAVRGFVFGYDFGTYEGKPALRIGDGVGLVVGDTEGDLYYAVGNGKMSLLHHDVFYTAEIFNGVADGDLLPLVANKTKTAAGEQADPSELVKAGWAVDADLGAAFLYQRDGTYRTGLTVDQYIEETGAAMTKFIPARTQILDASTGGSTLPNCWSTCATLRSALYDYATVKAGGPNSERGDFATFPDVPPEHYAYVAVDWALHEGITNGTSDATFSPDMTCTKAHILTFLYRAYDWPPVSGANPFSNVSTSAYYYQPALWANQKGLVSAGTFPADAPCDRATTVWYLWKLAGSPEPNGQSLFTDVPADGSERSKAIAWAVQQKITNGTSATTFSPDATCTRGQIVTLLYRALA